MNKRTLRIIIPLAFVAIAGIAFAANFSLGTLSSFGWEDIAVICPIGALGTMLASKTFVPRALVSLLLTVAGIALIGRAFCGWVCPVPVWSKIRNLFAKQDPEAAATRGEKRAKDHAATAQNPLSEEEMAILRTSCGKHFDHRKPSDSRHIVLGGALLSAAIFGFPVFCLICPVGLSFAGIFTLILLFGAGDLSWSVVAIPVVLALEVVFFRKWCSHICPISAFMSLVGKLNRTFLPSVDKSKCIESAKGAKCGRCAAVCEMGINPRHPNHGTSFAECTRCMECVDNCPGHAITLPLLAKTRAGGGPEPAEPDAQEAELPKAVGE